MRILSKIFSFRTIQYVFLFFAITHPYQIHASLVTFEDGTFSDSNWTLTLLVGPTGGQSGIQEAAGGNPAAFREVTTNTGSLVRVFHADPANVFAPSSGQINTLDFRIDYNALDTFGLGQGFGLMLKQGSGYYVSSSTNFVTGSAVQDVWLTKSVTGLTESDFALIIGSGALDFSTSGSPITFGFETFNSGGNGIIAGYDNWKVTLDTEASNAAVPEPSSFVLLLSVSIVIAGFILLRKCRRKTLLADNAGAV